MKQHIRFLIVILGLVLMTGCGASQQPPASVSPEPASDETAFAVSEGNPMTLERLEDGLSTAVFRGDDGFEDFLAAGGASADKDVLNFLMGRFSLTQGLGFETTAFGCSTISISDGEHWRFGRNFDWNRCDALVLRSYPTNGYASISTVNLDFITQAAGLIPLPDSVKVTAAVYAPLDGMNEKGLAVSVNMIQDRATIDQSTEKPDVTTTTAVRLLLNQAATVDEAVALLRQYDLHASFGFMVHFAIADAQGNSVAVEYINDTLTVLDTPILTNFYLAEGEKQGIGTQQSHTRFEMLTEALNHSPQMDGPQIRDTLSSVSKGNFGEFESTEWSAIFDQTAISADYYHREDYTKSWRFTLEG